MSTRGLARNAGLLGALFATLSVLAFPRMLRLFERTPLAMTVVAEDVAPGPLLKIQASGDRPVYVDGKEGSLDNPVSPGLHHVTWRETFQGGHERSVGHSQLVGPFQDPEKPPCGLSLLIAPAFLDQTAPILQGLVSKQLKGMSQWPVGDFLEVTDTKLSWTRWEQHPPSSFRRARLETAVGQPLQGHLRVRMIVEFENAEVPLSMMLVPIVFEQTLQFRVYVNAKLDLDNRLFQWVADFFDGNDRVSRLIDKELSREMRNVLDKPPDIPLEGGGVVALSFCEAGQLRFHEAGHVSMPLSVMLSSRRPAPPLHTTRSDVPSPAMSTPIAVELDQNAVAAVLHTLWSSGLLDKALATAAVRAFNEHPTVRDFLSVRLTDASFHLPPTVEFLTSEDGGLRLRTATSLVFDDAGSRTQARLFAEFDIAPTTLEPGALTDVLTKRLELTCIDIDEPGLLRPCYSQIMSQLRANQATLDEQLSSLLRDLLIRLFTQRTLSDSQTPASYRLESTDFQIGPERMRANLSGNLR